MKPAIFLITVFSGLGINGFAAQPLTPDEQIFVKEAATSDQAEIKFAQFALEHATTAAVKQFAQQMVTDHTKSTSMLKPIAGEHQVVLPDKLGPDANEDFQRLEKASGIAVDKTYIEMMVKDHETMLIVAFNLFYRSAVVFLRRLALSPCSRILGCIQKPIFSAHQEPQLAIIANLLRSKSVISPGTENPAL